jgi:hypothetical protein
MTKRDLKQEYFANIWLKERMGILYLCPRFGKIRTTIKILNKSNYKNILIAYPDKNIKNSWINDFNDLGYDYSNVTFTTFKSLHKCLDKGFDLVIADEIHSLSNNAIERLSDVINSSKPDVLGLTGTLSNDTKKLLYLSLGISVIASYSIEEAVQDEVISDYNITVIKVPLDNSIKTMWKNKHHVTEKEKYNWITKSINYFQLLRNDNMVKFNKFALINLLQNSISKIRVTKELLNRYSSERILVFCGTTDFTDVLGIPTNNSKNPNEEGFRKFAEGEGTHFSVIKIGNSGVTYKPLNKVIITNFDSNSENLSQKINRCMAIEYNNPTKKSEIYIISSNEELELKWLNKALSFFDKSKINFVNYSKF